MFIYLIHSSISQEEEEAPLTTFCHFPSLRLKPEAVRQLHHVRRAPLLPSPQDTLGTLTLRFSAPAVRRVPHCPTERAGAYLPPNPEKVKIRQNCLWVVIFSKSRCGLWIVNYTEAYFTHPYLGIVHFARPYHTLIQILL